MRRQAALAGPVEVTLDGPGSVVGAVAQVRVEQVVGVPQRRGGGSGALHAATAGLVGAVRIANVAGIQAALRVERRLDLPEPVVDIVSVKRGEVFGPRAAVSVLARQRAVELHHQVANIVGDRAQLGDVRRVFAVDHRAKVQATDRSVTVKTSPRVVIGHDLLQPLNVFRQPVDSDCGVLNEGDRLGVALQRHQQRQTRLPQLPDVGLLVRRGRPVEAVA